MSQGHRAALAHPIAQLSRHIWSIWADGLGETEALNCENATSPDQVDIAARSLKVATRVRIQMARVEKSPLRTPTRGQRRLTTIVSAKAIRTRRTRCKSSRGLSCQKDHFSISRPDALAHSSIDCRVQILPEASSVRGSGKS